MQVDISMDSKKFKCAFSITDKVTFIEGDSGEGKTQFSLRAASSSSSVKINVSNGFDLVTLTKKEFNRSLSAAKRHIERTEDSLFPSDKDKIYNLLLEYWSNEDNFPIFNSVIIIDDEDFVSSREFSAYYNADKYNYYIIINRREISGISYSADSIFCFKSNGTHHYLEKSIHYHTLNEETNKLVDWVVVEGSSSDFIFFSEMFKSNKVINPSYKSEDTTGGRAKIVKLLKRCLADFKYKRLLLLVDICAFGSNIKILQNFAAMHNIKLFFIQNYQSFEFLLLHSSMINDTALNDFFANNVLSYKSLEDLYTVRLENLTVGLPNHYSKEIKKFPVCYYKNCCSYKKFFGTACRMGLKFKKGDKFQKLFDKTEFEIINEIQLSKAVNISKTTKSMNLF